MFKLLALLIIGSFILFACEKEEKIDTCKDGILSPGEEGVDCGGNCPPCPPTPPMSFAFATVNDEMITFANYKLEKHDDWVLRFYNDSIDITLNLGNGDSLGARPLKSIYSTGYLNGKNYPILQSGINLITSIDHAEQKLSCFFEAKLTQDPNHINYNMYDTLIVKQGDFENIVWE